MKQRSGSSSLFALKLKSFASLVKWCAAHYTLHMECHVSLRDLYGLCVNARTDSGKSLAVWMNQNQTILGWFPEHITRVFSGIAVWKRLYRHDIAPPFFSVLHIVFCLPFIFPQHEGKIAWIYEWTAHFKIFPVYWHLLRHLLQTSQCSW